MTTSPAITRLATNLAGFDTAKITRGLNDRISLAYHQPGEARTIALDFNARLITELREQRIWPERRPRPT